jgi:GNAT superfamily N-acetyltransferase
MAPEALDRVAPAGWRCLATLDGPRLAAYAFVERRPEGPHLFRAHTDPDLRGQRLFSRLTSSIASRLHAEGERTLTSSTAIGNRPSLRAHRAAGFVVAKRHLDLVVLGMSLRRLLAWARRRATAGGAGVARLLGRARRPAASGLPGRALRRR